MDLNSVIEYIKIRSELHRICLSKIDAVNNMDYEGAANLRNEEKVVLSMMDNIDEGRILLYLNDILPEKK